MMRLDCLRTTPRARKVVEYVAAMAQRDRKRPIAAWPWPLSIIPEQASLEIQEVSVDAEPDRFAVPISGWRSIKEYAVRDNICPD